MIKNPCRRKEMTGAEEQKLAQFHKEIAAEKLKLEKSGGDRERFDIIRKNRNKCNSENSKSRPITQGMPDVNSEPVHKTDYAAISGILFIVVTVIGLVYYHKPILDGLLSCIRAVIG
jgi:hypothetical protein